MEPQSWYNGRDFRSDGRQPNQAFGQTADIKALIKELVQQELQEQYDARLSDLEKRVCDLEENYRDLAALVRGRQKSGHSATSARAKVEKGRTDVRQQDQTQQRTHDLQARVNNVDVTYQELRTRLAYGTQYEDFDDDLFSTVSGYDGSAEDTCSRDAQTPSPTTEDYELQFALALSRSEAQAKKKEHSSSSRHSPPRHSPPSYPYYSGQGFGTLPFSPSPRVERTTPLFNAQPSVYNTPPRGVHNNEYKPSPELTKKHQKFMTDPYEFKPVTALAGIGKTYGARLESAGYDSAKKVLQKYQALGRNELKFKSWLKSVTGANSLNQDRCYACVREWEGF